MSIPFPITPKELRAIRKVLRHNPVVYCVGDHAYIATLLVARDLVLRGETNIAKVERESNRPALTEHSDPSPQDHPTPENPPMDAK